MSVKLEPQGTKILVLPLETKHAETEGGLTIVDTELTEGEKHGFTMGARVNLLTRR